MKLFPRAVISVSAAAVADPTSRPRTIVTTTVAVIGTLTLPATGHALGLGRAIGEPVLGEAVQIEIPLTGTIDRPLGMECISLRRPPESIDADYFPRDLTARLDRTSGTPRLVLSTRSAVRQPLVEFRVSVSCGYNLSHDYLLMASPRVEPVPPVAAAPGKIEALVPATTAAGRTPMPSTTETPVMATASGVALPDGLPARSMVLDQDMTLEQLARTRFPGPLRQGRFMRWVIEANPGEFASADKSRQHRLRKGTQLLIPEGVPPRRPGDYKDGKTPLDEPMASATAEPPPASSASRKTPKAAVAATSQASPSRAASDASKDRLVVGGGGTAKDVKETVALVGRLTGMMEQQLSAQGANDEKIKQLEAKVAELGKTIEKLETDGRQREARWQAERLAERAVREQETDRGWWQLLLAVAVGGIVGAGLLHAARLFLRRGKQPAITDGPTAELADNEPGALTEFGWDDEPLSARNKGTQAVTATAPAPVTSTTLAPPTVMPAATPAPAPGPAPTASPTTADTGLDMRPARAEPITHLQFEPPAYAAASEATAGAPGDPARAAIELANIMTAMGLSDSAARTLVEHIRENPRQSLEHWLKLLELYRLNGNRKEFERSAEEMHQHFNVQVDQWVAEDGSERTSLEDYPHLRSQLVRRWRQPDACELLQTLLMDNREGTRIGFPINVAEEILLLLAILDSPQ
jgi:hypothetical protein